MRSLSLVKEQRRGRRAGRSLTSTASLGMRGDLEDDYRAVLEVAGVNISVCVDTGSTVLAVAGSASLGCDHFVDSERACNASALQGAVYGSCSWSGVGCEGDVVVGGMVVKQYEFAAMLEETGMTTCPGSSEESPTAPGKMVRPGNEVEGIWGLAFTARGVTPLLEALFQQAAVAPVFGMQFCGYDAATQLGGEGALDLGGFDSRHYTGVVQWVPVTQRKWWAVRLVSVGFVGGVNLLPEEVAATTVYVTTDRPQTIVDSGSSTISLETATFESLVNALIPHQGDRRFWRGETCIPAGMLDLASLPTIELLIESSSKPVKLRIPPCRYVALQPAGRGGCADTEGTGWFFASALADAGPPGENMILGQPLFEEYYVAHDASPLGKIGFAPIAGCGEASRCPSWNFQVTAPAESKHLATIIVIFLMLPVTLACLRLAIFRRRKHKLTLLRDGPPEKFKWTTEIAPSLSSLDQSF